MNQKKVGGDGRVVRVCGAQREQMVFRAVKIDELVGEDHVVRAIWEFVGGLDLSGFYEKIESVEGEAGRPSWDSVVGECVVVCLQ